ncbi:MAG TPA: PAS domain S-box protein [Thermoanaerobaculia bacterium]|jgi:PAS domain S-box-containing protein|nr:PAS domain S-box protein [Thermoanaerobaculia bacterium]
MTRIPPTLEDPERSRDAGLLQTILWSVMIVEAVALLVVLIFMPAAVMSRWAAAVGSMLASSLLCLILVRRGRTRLASVTLVGVFWIIVTTLALTGGGTLAPAASGFLVAIIGTRLLMGTRAAIVVAVVSSATELALAYAESNALLPTRESAQNPYAYWLAHSLFAALAVVLVHRAMRDERSQRRTAQDALEESEEQFRVMFEHAAIGMALVAADGRFVRSNPALVRLLGYSHHDLSRMGFAELTHPDDVALDLELYRSLLAGERDLYEIEKRYIRSNGGTLWGQLTVSVVKQPDGIIRFAIGMVEDITARKQNEEASRILLNTLGERVKELTALHEAARVLQRDHDDVDTILRDVVALLPPAFQYPDSTSAHISLGKHEAATPGFDHTGSMLRADLTTSDGTTGCIEIAYTGEPIADEGEPFVAEELTLLHTLADMLRTAIDRRSASTALRESEGRFRELTEHIREVFWMVAVDSSETLYISPAYESVYGRTRESAYQDPLSFTQAIHPDDRARVLAIIERDQAKGFELEYRIVRPDGDVRWIWDRGFPIQDASGRVYRVAGIAEDITERKKLEEQLRRTQRLESIGTLASGIAHDLNNVLAPILLSVDVLRRRVTDPRLLAMIESLATSTKRGKEIVKQVLTFARGSEHDFEPQYLPDVVAEMESFIRETFPRTIELRVDVPRDMPPVLGNATQLHQILMNLCVNACDAMPHGGRLTISTMTVHLSASDVRAYSGCEPGEYVVLLVSDSGTGMPPEIQEKIFEPFFTTKDIGKGTGLGLSTVYSIVRDHRGFIRVASEIGKGTDFVIHLPAFRQEVRAPQLDATPAIVGGQGECVLIIDDEQAVVHIARVTLETYGYRVLTASDGVEAAHLVRNEPPGSIALVITDVHMPLMDGFETTKVLRRHDPAIPVLVTSGAPTDGDRERLEAMQCNGYLSKPYTSEQLFAAIDAIVHR